MTRDDIIRMARRAGVPHTFDGDLCIDFDVEVFERFAALVAAAEREACINIVSKYGCWNDCECDDAIRARGEKP